MKYIYKLLGIALLALVLSCNSDDRILFDPNNLEASNTLLGFEGQTADLVILINDVGTVDVTINVSTISPNDRTFNLRVGEASTADPIYFELPESIVIPANEFSATFTINGVDPLGEMIDPQVLIIEFDDPDNAVTIETFTVNLLIICPIGEDEFLGDYVLTNQSTTEFGNLFLDGQVVTVQQGEESISRFFEAIVLEDLDPDFPVIPVIWNHVCDQIVPVSDQPTGLTCGGGNLILGIPDGELGLYTTGDDTTFTVILGYNLSGEATCSAPQDYMLTFTRQ